MLCNNLIFMMLVVKFPRWSNREFFERNREFSDGNRELDRLVILYGVFGRDTFNDYNLDAQSSVERILTCALMSISLTPAQPPVSPRARNGL